MKLHEAQEVVRLAKIYDENVETLKALRGTITDDVLDVGGVTLQGKTLDPSLRLGVLAAVRDHLDMRFARRNQQILGQLYSLGLEH